MVKRILCVFLLLCILLSTGGCAPNPSDLGRLELDVPSTKDPFAVIPTTQASVNTDNTKPLPEEEVGRLNFGLADENPTKDENGLRYLEYTDGELAVPYQINATGAMFADGVGLLLFLNGVPQPYHTDTYEEVRYLHTFYGDERGDISQRFDFCFTPVTGQAGETLELYVLSITNPNCEPSERPPFAYTFGSGAHWERLHFAAAPKDTPEPPVPQYPLSYTVEYKDVTYSDIAGWSEEELLNNTEYRFSINGVADHGGKRTVYQVTPEEPVQMQFSLWGSSRAKFGLSFFVDNQPVSLNGAMSIPMEIREGQKTIVELTLTLPEFDGDAAVYAVLAPLNYWDDLDNSWFLTESGTIFLTAEEEE